MTRLTKLSRDKTKRTARMMQARFAAVCICGADIAMGDLIFYDRNAAVRVLCVTCGRNQSRQAKALSLSETPELLTLMERVNQMLALGLKMSNSEELSDAVHKLAINHATHSDARKLICSLSMCSPVADFVGISVRFAGQCTHCSTTIKAGATALYDRAARRLHCLDCELTSSLN